MIARIWHGWTARDGADHFQRIMCDHIIPAFEAREVAGLMQIDLLRRDDGDEVEFTTIILFDTLEAIERFTGDDATSPRIPPEARALLTRGDAQVTHHEIVDRRVVPDHARGRF